MKDSLAAESCSLLAVAPATKVRYFNANELMVDLDVDHLLIRPIGKMTED
jgi:hypothetical protein